MVRKLGVGLAVLAVAAVLVLYLNRADDPRSRTATSRRATAAPVAEPDAAKAPEAPPDAAARVVRILVHDTEGKPIAGAAVGRMEEGKPVGEPVKTGADGRCEVSLPDLGWYVVDVSHPDFVRGWLWTSARKPEQEIALQRGTSLTVLVTDPTGKPVAGAAVGAHWERSRGTPGFWRWSDAGNLGEFATGEDGRAAVGPVPAATIVVKVDHPPYALQESAFDVTGDAPVEHMVRLDLGGILVGRVVGPGGEGVPGATVKCKDLARPLATSGPGGDFRLEGAPAGGVEIVAEAEGYGPGFFGASLGWGNPVPVQVRPGETVTGLEILLSKAVYVVGVVVDEEGKPLKDVTVYASIARGFSYDTEAKSREDGRFRAGPFSVRQPGRVWAWFNAAGYAFEQASGEAQPGTDVDLGEIRGTRRATVRGVLVDEAGAPVEGRVLIQLGQGTTVGTSKPDGTFEMESVGPGKVTLVADRLEEPKLKSAPLEIETASGQVIEGLEIVLHETKAIRGRVIMPDGNPRPGATLGLRLASGGGPSVRVGTDREGKFTFDDLVEGDYEVGLVSGYGWGEDMKFLEQPAPVKAAAGRDDLEFIFPLKGAIVVGKVVAKRDGRPIREFGASFIQYKLFIPEGSEFDSFTDENGEFRHEVDEPGAWQVDISATGYAAHRTDRFSLDAGEVKDVGTIRLGPGGTIAGRVVDAQQQPVAYARVNILNAKMQTNEDEPYTDADGRFEVPGVSPGMFTVFAVSPRHPLGMVRGVMVKEGEKADVQITFVEAAPLTIDVRDPSGQPVEGAALDFTFPAVAPLTSKMFRGKIPPGYGSHKSDAEGTIFQPCLPPGEVTITIEADGFEPVTKKLELKPGESNRIEIRLRRKS
ncbi:MAG TPA: carboxypeptidase-like regulatory domain-containing protein [Planctomycetota bacterium]|nr:carboxypeptidase-like regulatory domain-containing protein [Planctomycetota bacterium]